MSPAQLDAAWKQVQQHFRQCPTCDRMVCLSDFDTQSGFCQEDSPRTDEIAEARGAQAGAALKGLASAFGLGGVIDDAGKSIQQSIDSAQRAAGQMARCPQDGTLAAPGTKFCPECGSPMVQPAKEVCPKCGAETHGAKFCPECGTKIQKTRYLGGACYFCPKCQV